MDRVIKQYGPPNDSELKKVVESCRGTRPKGLKGRQVRQSCITIPSVPIKVSCPAKLSFSRPACPEGLDCSAGDAGTPICPSPNDCLKSQDTVIADDMGSYMREAPHIDNSRVIKPATER